GALMTFEHNIFSRYNYFLNSNNYMYGGSILTIDDNVMEDGGYYFIDELRLYDVTEDGPTKMVMTNNDINSSYAAFDYIHINNYSEDEYSVIMKDNNITLYNNSKMRFNGASMTQGSVLLEGNVYTNVGLEFTNMKEALVTGNTIQSYTDNYALYMYTSNVVVEYNDIIDNKRTGIYVNTDFNYLSAADTIRYNTITGNNEYNNSGYAGIVIENYANPVIWQNNIHGNTISDIYNNSSVNDIDARFNYLGEETLTEIGSGDNPQNLTKIYDEFDNADKGFVNYAGWLS
ncbi:uncharacterized protein METZ01_LOCUS395008, partial [marine metagenome]